jgi:hypothetical protein
MTSGNPLMTCFGRGACVATLSVLLMFLTGCGGGSSSSPSSSSGSGSSGSGSSGSGSSGSGSSTVNNTQPIAVNLGPSNAYGPNGIFTSVTICVPSTSTCEDIPDVLVDTGSYGLRLLSSAVTVTLTGVSGDSSGDTLQECIAYADGSFTFGPVATADIQMAGEKASAVPIQIISATENIGPSTCASGTNSNTVQALGANGIIGIGPFQQDCGSACASSTPPAQYYVCPSSGCTVVSVAVASQLQNPVWMFPQDNNGVLIALPSVPAAGAASVTASMYFGIGTQSDNALGSAQIYTADGCGNITTTFNGTTYSDTSTSCTGGTYFDTGSEGLYIVNSGALNSILQCSGTVAPSIFYCPASTTTFNATNTGANGTQAQVSFSVANADSLYSSSNAAFNDLAGSNASGGFDWGLPFFFGRNVFVGIQGENSPTGVAGPYWAF